MSRHLFLLSLLALLTSGMHVSRAAPEVAVQAFPYHPGFPRLEPHGQSTSPSVVDLNGDGSLDILVGDSGGCVWGWNQNGSLLPGFPWVTASGTCKAKRINSALAIGDLNGDGTLEVAAATRGMSNDSGQRGKVYLWNANGVLLPGWPKEMDWNTTYAGGISEVTGVVFANVAGDAQLEILAGTDNNSVNGTPSDPSLNVYAWFIDGSLLPGYPTWYRSAGIFAPIGAADLTRDNYAEVITGRDHAYLYAYTANGQQLPGWPVHTYVDPARTDYTKDLILGFTNNPPAMGDLDGDGIVEVVTAAKVSDPQQNHATIGSAVLVLEPNGQRRAGWTIAKLGGPPLHDAFFPYQAPALADLDGDGKSEIVVAMFDGVLRVYRENGNLLWTYNYAQGQKLFGSEPVIGDVTGDGRLDILFGTYSPDGSANASVRLMGLDANGVPLPGFPLSLTHEGSSQTPGVRSAPALADLDRDCDLEIVAASWAGTMYVWDLPAPYRADLLPWPTSRHNNQRTGSAGGFIAGAALQTAGTVHALYLPLVMNRSCAPP
jgi:hypothetical protein